MALIARIPIVDVATGAARALEQLLGHDVILTTGPPAFGPPTGDVLPEGATRSIALPFVDGAFGEISIVVSEQFATALQAVTPDAELLSATMPVLAAAADAIEAAVPVHARAEGAGEIATETLLSGVDGDFAAVAILENDERVGTVVVRVLDTPVPAASARAPEPAPVTSAAAMPAPLPVAASPIEPALSIEPALPVAPVANRSISMHEFQPLGDGQGGMGQARSLTLLNDVTTDVTAELGRRRLKVRDIIALKPGSVVVLDRTAGSPVDVLVNGALVWHGEVVVVDDEFGIRVSEIVIDEN